MKHLIGKLERTIVFVLKTCLYAALFISFFGIMGIDNPQLLRFSRTSGVTMLTFVVAGLGMTAAYGRYDIGKRKSKPIISSIGLATLITDIVTYIELSIMNTNPANNTEFKFESIGLFFIVVAVQVMCITVFTYGGNWIYFTLYDPERCCIVTSSRESFLQISHAIDVFRKQYRICEVKDYQADDLYEAVLRCDTVFLYDVPIKERTELIEYCYRNMRSIYFSPEISDIVEINSKHVILDDISLINLPVKELSVEQRFMKRFMDIIFSAAAIVMTSPIWLICAAAIKIDDGGKVFFKQKRATKDGKVFEVYKFRTMKENVKNYSSVADDDRITSVGKILRKYRLDEFPQFLNILFGDMSLVGPRPEMLENVYLYTKEYPEFAYRLRVKAGLTGYAQIAGKYNTTPKYKLILDLMYIENYSILKDIKLVLQTLIVFFKPDSTEAFDDSYYTEHVAKFAEFLDANWKQSEE
ncbi:exopolysaccharide biosynthesis polyprenyl glycosylphosphotransferase [Frisingicoccus sp.]|uniref:exopolysaccharide biosynthesis polyprenyl glycosylphosphotransferase n=1 Tax=Frisingicoccus sp. TaxID=1918627 RepID=UPI003AB8F996